MSANATKLDIKTIHEFLAEQPNVDVSDAWKRCWAIQQGIVDGVRARPLLGARAPAGDGDQRDLRDRGAGPRGLARDHRSRRGALGLRRDGTVP